MYSTLLKPKHQQLANAMMGQVKCQYQSQVLQ